MKKAPLGMKAVTERHSNFIFRHPLVIVLATIMIAILAASGIPKLKMSNNYRVFFGKDNPDLLAFDHLQNTYTKTDNILFTVVPRDGNVFTPETMDAVELLTEKAWTIPYATRVDSITNFQHSWADGDDLTVEDLIRNGKSMSPQDLQDKERIAHAEPLLEGNLIAPDSGATGVNATLQFPEVSEEEVPEAMGYARGLVTKLESEYPNLTIAISGASALNSAFTEGTEKDMQTVYPGMFIALVLATFLMLRSAWGTFVTVVVIGLSTASAMGVAGYIGITMEPFSSSSAIIILTLAIADSIHILVYMVGLMRKGEDKNTALRESLRVNLVPVSITSLTTMVGFLSLNFSDSPPFHNLGNITAIGIAFAWFYSLTLLPAAIVLLPIHFKPHAGEYRGLQGRLDSLADFVIAKYRLVLTGSVVLALALFAAIPMLELNDEWVKYFDHRVKFRVDAEYTMEHLTGLYAVDYSVPSEGPEGISSPEFLSNLDEFTGWLRDQDEVIHVFSYSDIVKRLNKNMHGDDDAWYRIPDDRELAAQYLLLYELSLPYGLDLNDRINVDKSSTRMTVVVDELSTVEMRAFLDRSVGWVDANSPDYMTIRPTGPAVMFSNISKRNIEEMFRGNILAVVLIALIMVVTLRSLKLGLLSIIPNAVPILMTFGLWALLVGQVGMAGATVSATALGIIVDDTVHLLSKYLYARREKNLDGPDAIRFAFQTVGLAIVANSFILALGFGVLALSTFTVTNQMGLLTALAVVVALVADFLLLPSLLLFGQNSRKGVSNESDDLAQSA